MKIETIVKTHRGQPVKYAAGIRVLFDANGVAEINDKDGAFLIDKYAGQIFPAGKVVQPVAQVLPASNKADGSVVEDLREKLNRANRLVDDYKGQANTAKQNEAVWRTKCEELMGQITQLQAQIGKKAVLPQPEKKEVVIEKQTELSIRQKLEAKTTKELITFAEELKLSKAEYQKLTKAKLVDFLIAKTNAS